MVSLLTRPKASQKLFIRSRVTKCVKQSGMRQLRSSILLGREKGFGKICSSLDCIELTRFSVPRLRSSSAVFRVLKIYDKVEHLVEDVDKSTKLISVQSIPRYRSSLDPTPAENNSSLSSTLSPFLVCDDEQYNWKVIAVSEFGTLRLWCDAEMTYLRKAYFVNQHELHTSIHFLPTIALDIFSIWFACVFDIMDCEHHTYYPAVSRCTGVKAKGDSHVFKTWSRFPTSCSFRSLRISTRKLRPSLGLHASHPQT
jgi:hypothetical protein